jgi:hypothetical protein
VYDLCQATERRVAAALMELYADTPMDFADATLVLLPRLSTFATCSPSTVEASPCTGRGMDAR